MTCVVERIVPRSHVDRELDSDLLAAVVYFHFKHIRGEGGGKETGTTVHLPQIMYFHPSPLY